MKVALGLISSIVMPFLEVQCMLRHRRRVQFAILLWAAGFIFFMSATMLGLIDLALQYDAQGFVTWTAILSVATLFITLAVLSFALAKVIFPKPNLSAVSLLRFADDPEFSRQESRHPRGDSGIDQFPQPGLSH